MVVIQNGFDTDVFRPDPAQRARIRREWGIGDELLIGVVARLHPQKDHATFLTAMALVAESHPSARYVLCGEGVSRGSEPFASMLAASPRLSERCLLRGSRDDVPAVLNALDIAVLSSAYGEGFPNIIGEAMACGVPCVVTDVGDAPALVADTGVVVSPRNAAQLASACVALIDMGAENRRRRGAAARRRVVGEYGLMRIADRYPRAVPRGARRTKARARGSAAGSGASWPRKAARRFRFDGGPLMCGFAGFIDPRLDPRAAAVIAARMGSTLAHRGPDAEGLWQDEAAGYAVAHRRLSILDLSPLGHQPMPSRCGRYVIAFNGEIYNYRDLRHDMERRGVRFRGHSDTEVLLAVIAELGFVEALGRLNGMFAIALWDVAQRRLLLARDRLGEKPLYYGRSGGAFLFGSELKAIRVHPAFAAEVDRGALALFLRHNFVPAPWSIYVGIRKLLPATWLEVEPDGRFGEPVPYWSVRESAERGLSDPFAGSVEDATDELERALGEAVRSRMVADVPLGAFLSGGIDSSLVVALMTRHSSRPVRTFSIGFQDPLYDEAPHAGAVARHLGTDHTEMYVSPEQALGVVPLLPRIYDEPFADSSQVPTFLVSQLARQHVTVALSGDGGDELFCGYDRYLLGRAVWNKLARVPRPLRRAAASSVHALSPRALEASAAVLRRVAPGRFWPARAVADRLYKAANLIAVGSQEELYLHLMSHWKRPEELLATGSEPATQLSDPAAWPGTGFTDAMMLQDIGMYLPDDILTKVDRASMAVSLETRVPLLDHRVVELAWRLPLAWKLHGSTGKWLLRRVLERHVPPALFERPKTGFGVPLEDWLRGPLRDWAEASLDASRLRSAGYFEPAPIRAAWEAHLSGRSNFHYPLWDVLMFQGWLDEQSAPPAAGPLRARVVLSGAPVPPRALTVALEAVSDAASRAGAQAADIPR